VRKSKITQMGVKTKLRNQSLCSEASPPFLKIWVPYPRRLGIREITSATLLISQQSQAVLRGLILRDLTPDSPLTITPGHPLALIPQPAISSLPRRFLGSDLLQSLNDHKSEKPNHSNVTPCAFEPIPILGRPRFLTTSQHQSIVSGYNESMIAFLSNLKYGILKRISRR
jgi:hypothetical protein